MDCEAYLERLEREAGENHTGDLYLWPRTPIANIQAEIWRRVGASDWNLADDSRSRRVLDLLDVMRLNWLVPERFTFLDICCGDGVIPWQVRRRYPLSRCFGVDINKNRLPAHALVQDMGVRLYRVPIQRLFQSHAVDRFDVVAMFNTYRGWDAADLHDDEAWLPDAADEWFGRHAEYTILTVSDGQKQRLIDKGFWVSTLGPGEDGSEMVIMWPCDQGAGLWSPRRP